MILLLRSRFRPPSTIESFIMTKKLSEIKLGEPATILSFIEDDISENLMKMGFIPGELVKIERFAPLGDPIVVEVLGYQLSIRRAEADRVLVDDGK